MDVEPLIVRLRTGDEAALTELLDRYQPRLLKHAERIVHSHAVAEEILQDTWIAVYTGIGRFEGRSSLITWITHIMIRRAASALDRESRAVPVDSGVLDQVFEPNTVYPAVGSDTIDDRVTAQQAMHKVIRVLPQLPDSERSVWTLYDVDHATATEVTARLGLSPSHQRVLLHRARTRLRRHLEPELGRW